MPRDNEEAEVQGEEVEETREHTSDVDLAVLVPERYYEEMPERFWPQVHRRGMVGGNMVEFTESEVDEIRSRPARLYGETSLYRNGHRNAEFYIFAMTRMLMRLVDPGEHRILVVESSRRPAAKFGDLVQSKHHWLRRLGVEYTHTELDGFTRQYVQRVFDGIESGVRRIVIRRKQVTIIPAALLSRYSSQQFDSVFLFQPERYLSPALLAFVTEHRRQQNYETVLTTRNRDARLIENWPSCMREIDENNATIVAAYQPLPPVLVRSVGAVLIPGTVDEEVPDLVDTPEQDAGIMEGVEWNNNMLSNQPVQSDGVAAMRNRFVTVMENSLRQETVRDNTLDFATLYPSLLQDAATLEIVD